MSHDSENEAHARQYVVSLHACVLRVCVCEVSLHVYTSRCWTVQTVRDDSPLFSFHSNQLTPLLSNPNNPPVETYNFVPVSFILPTDLQKFQEEFESRVS